MPPPRPVHIGGNDDLSVLERRHLVERRRARQAHPGHEIVRNTDAQRVRPVENGGQICNFAYESRR